MIIKDKAKAKGKATLPEAQYSFIVQATVATIVNYDHSWFIVQATGKLRHDTQHNDIHHNDSQHYDTQHNHTQHNDTQYNGTQHNDTQHNDTQHNNIQHNDI